METMLPLTIALGGVAGAPLVNGCPLHLECRNGGLAAHPGTVLIEAEGTAIHCPRGTLGSEHWPDLARLLPLTNLSPGACREPGAAGTGKPFETT